MWRAPKTLVSLVLPPECETISQRVLTFKAKFDTVCKAPLEENEFLEWFNLEKYELGEKQNLI